jgi:hypothetical protein
MNTLSIVGIKSQNLAQLIRWSQSTSTGLNEHDKADLREHIEIALAELVAAVDYLDNDDEGEIDLNKVVETGKRILRHPNKFISSEILSPHCSTEHVVLMTGFSYDATSQDKYHGCGFINGVEFSVKTNGSKWSLIVRTGQIYERWEDHGLIEGDGRMTIEQFKQLVLTVTTTWADLRQLDPVA